MVRVDTEETEALVAKPHARPFEMRGRPTEGWLRVDAVGLRTKRQLVPWVQRGVRYARPASKAVGRGPECRRVGRWTAEPAGGGSMPLVHEMSEPDRWFTFHMETT